MSATPIARSDEQRRIEELTLHMQQEGELVEGSRGLEFAEPAPALAGDLVLEQHMKLVCQPGSPELFAVPSDEDWMHDSLGEVHEVPGVLYADDEPFLAGSATATGYFQADDDGRWARVRNGRAQRTEHGGADWKDSLEDFPEVMEQLAQCMDVPEYRHVAEQAAMKRLVENNA